MLDISWIFASGVGFRELVASLSNTPHESVFSTNLVTTLFEIFDKRYKKHIWWKCFIPYVIYFVFSVSFYTTFTTHGIINYSDGE